VDVDLIVRDICRLRPGVEGLSETVTVRSVVGRFLEHSRIFYVENGGDPEYYLGSADWMTRNLDNRVEAVAPVEAVELREQLRFVLEASLSDNRRRWEMRSDGSYEQVTPGEDPVRDVQEILMDAADAAINQGYGPGLVIDEELIDGDLLIEPTRTDAADPPPSENGNEDTGGGTDGGADPEEDTDGDLGPEASGGADE
jgi:polyphosphate kinase